MIESNSDTKNSVWDNLEELRHLFPTKSYQDLLERKTQNNREGFGYLLEIIFDANSELAQKVQIEFMGIEEIAQALEIEAHDNLIDKKAYIDRANYWAKRYQKEDAIYATLLNNLAVIYHSMGEYAKALQYHQKALTIREKVLGDQHPDTAQSYNNIGVVYDSKGEYDKALEFFQKSLAIREEVLGTNHPDTAGSYNNIGAVYDSIGEYDKALEFFQKSLTIIELGTNHPDTATSYNNIGGVYDSIREYDKALEFYQKSLAIQEEVLGIKHPDTAGSYNNIAVLYYKMQNYPESAKYMQKAKDILEKVLPDNHPNLMSAKENLTIIKQSIKPIEIDKSYLDAIKIKNYFSLKDTEIENLGDKREIYFVGENGDGKTILLQAIVLALKGKKYNPFAEVYIEDIKDMMQLSAKVTYRNSDQKYKNVQNIFAYGINRNKISDEKFDKSGYAGIFDTPDFEESIKLKRPNDFLETKSKLRDDFVAELENLMDNKLKIIRNDNKIEFQEINGNPIKFGMLSEGYKTTIIWLSDLLSRLMENQPDIQALEDYEAIVLIDEVDLYLHPKWKYDFMYKLRKIFPKIQFIVTTHSLVTVLGASEDAVFYKLYRNEEGHTQVSQQIDDISHYTANILMTSPLFDLDSMKVRGFDKDERLSSDDYIYREIHQAVREYMQDNPSAMSEELKQKAKDELKARMAQLRQK